MQATTFPCWIQSKMKVVAWCFCSNEVYFVHQLHRSLVLPLPLHNQLTFRDPLTWLKLICILPRDLDLSMRILTLSIMRSNMIQIIQIVVHASLTVGKVNGVIFQPSFVTSPSTGMSRVISLRTNLTRRLASFVAKWS